MDKEMEKFRQDLLNSAQQMKAGKAARATQVALSPIAEARNRLRMSQSELAALMGVSPRTLQDWEQGRRKPTGAAQTLLRVAIVNPEALRNLKAA
jgi:putative transcriptional regulator